MQLAVGDGALGATLAAAAGVDVVVLVGSIEAGRSVAGACAARGAKAVLELGGKDPLIVDAGAAARPPGAAGRDGQGERRLRRGARRRGDPARGVGGRLGYGPELLDELTRVRVLDVQAPPGR